MASPIIPSSSAQGTPVPGIVRVFGDSRFHADGELLAFAFAGDGTLWSVEEPGVLRSWNAAGRNQAYRFLSDWETSWAFSQDGGMLASGSDDASL